MVAAIIQSYCVIEKVFEMVCVCVCMAIRTVTLEYIVSVE